MNFLAHYVIATRYLTPLAPLAGYAAGSALPDLLPLAAPRARLRPVTVSGLRDTTAGDAALRAGVTAHLAADGAFHKTAAFTRAQAEAGEILRGAGFAHMRLRVFFVAHVLVELALDAALLRADAGVADEFYGAFAAADPAEVTAWTETALERPLPALPGVLGSFARSRYLYGYADDAGVAEGLNRVCARARQDTFDSENGVRLVVCVARAIRAVTPRVPELLEETAANLGGSENT